MAAKKNSKRGLGRGLGALFEDVSVTPLDGGGDGYNGANDADDANDAGEGSRNKASKSGGGRKNASGGEASENSDALRRGDITYVPIDDIKPNSAQPRRHFEEESLEELASSILKYGLIQPIMVKRGGAGYELVAGERRWRAARKAGLREIPSIIRDVSAEENALFALIENIQREDLNPMEEARAYRGIMDDYGFTQEDVSKSVGKSRPYVANTLRLLKLPERVREYISEGKLSAGHANAIGSVAGDDAKQRLAERIMREGLSVREAEVLSRKINGKAADKVKKPSGKGEKDPEIKMIEEELTTLFGTKVTIGRNASRGIVEIHYYSRDELDGLIEELMRLKA
jgi:ParB family chromosome partitioning protein